MSPQTFNVCVSVSKNMHFWASRGISGDEFVCSQSYEWLPIFLSRVKRSGEWRNEKRATDRFERTWNKIRTFELFSVSIGAFSHSLVFVTIKGGVFLEYFAPLKKQ